MAQRQVAGNVGRQNQMLGVPQGVIFRQRLRVDNVQRGAGNVVGVQGLGQRRLIQRAAPAHIDDNGLLRQTGNSLAVENIHCLRRIGKRHDQQLCVRQQTIQLRDRVGLIENAGLPGLSAAAEADDFFSAHASHPAGNIAAEVAGA